MKLTVSVNQDGTLAWNGSPINDEQLRKFSGMIQIVPGQITTLVILRPGVTDQRRDNLIRILDEKNACQRDDKCILIENWSGEFPLYPPPPPPAPPRQNAPSAPNANSNGLSDEWKRVAETEVCVDSKSEEFDGRGATFTYRICGNPSAQWLNKVDCQQQRAPNAPFTYYLNKGGQWVQSSVRSEEQGFKVLSSECGAWADRRQ